jgi:hypothetical protein
MPASSVDGWSAPAPIVPRTAPPLRRIKPAQIYRKAGNLRAVQLHGDTKLESTVRYLGVELDDALAISEQVECRPERSTRGSGASGAAVHRMPRRLRSEPDFFARVPGPVAYVDHRWPRSWRRGNARQPLGARPGSTY